MGVFSPILRSYFPPPPVSEDSGEGLISQIGSYFSVKNLAHLMENRSISMLVVFLFITIILSPIVIGNPESTFDVKEYADN